MQIQDLMPRLPTLRRFLSGKTERSCSQTGTVDISIKKTSNHCSNYLPLSSTWTSLQNKIHSQGQNLVYELGLESYFKHIYCVSKLVP